MKLSELNPKLSDTGMLRFECPACTPRGMTHSIRIALVGSNHNVTKWDHNLSGWDDPKFPDTLTLYPSVDAGCWHGHIRDWAVQP
jgi:hypothetical protein